MILNYNDFKLDELSTIKEKHYLKSKNIYISLYGKKFFKIINYS